MAISIRAFLFFFVASIWLALSASDRPLILTFGPKGGAFDDVAASITDELSEDFEVATYNILGDKVLEQFEAQMLRNPAALIIMDNYMINIYRQYQIKYDGQRAFPPTLAVMALFMEDAISGIKNIEGVSYETSALNSFVNLRDVITNPLVRIGVIYRKQSQKFISRQSNLCDPEKFTLVPYRLNNKEPNLEEALREGLDELIKKQKVDAIWILNDSGLLGPDLIRNAWIPKLKSFHKPVIVGVVSLIEIPNMGNFAVLPDHREMGRQIAQTILRWSDNDWAITSGLVKEPISSFTILNMGFAKRYLSVRKEKLGQIDILLSR